jgi:hypothetical protein
LRAREEEIEIWEGETKEKEHRFEIRRKTKKRQGGERGSKHPQAPKPIVTWTAQWPRRRTFPGSARRPSDINRLWEWKRNEVRKQLETREKRDESEVRKKNLEKTRGEEEEQAEVQKMARSLVEQMFEDAMTQAAKRMERIEGGIRNTARGHQIELLGKWHHAEMETYEELREWVEEHGVKGKTWAALGKNGRIEREPLPFSIRINITGCGGGQTTSDEDDEPTSPTTSSQEDTETESDTVQVISRQQYEQRVTTRLPQRKKKGRGHREQRSSKATCRRKR